MTEATLTILDQPEYRKQTENSNVYIAKFIDF